MTIQDGSTTESPNRPFQFSLATGLKVVAVCAAVLTLYVWFQSYPVWHTLHFSTRSRFYQSEIPVLEDVWGVQLPHHAIVDLATWQYAWDGNAFTSRIQIPLGEADEFRNQLQRLALPQEFDGKLFNQAPEWKNLAIKVDAIITVEKNIQVIFSKSDRETIPVFIELYYDNFQDANEAARFKKIRNLFEKED